MSFSNKNNNSVGDKEGNISSKKDNPPMTYFNKPLQIYYSLEMDTFGQGINRIETDTKSCPNFYTQQNILISRNEEKFLLKIRVMNNNYNELCSQFSFPSRNPLPLF